MSATSRAWSSHGRRRYGAGGSALSRFARRRRGALRPSQGALDLGNQSDRHATVAGCRLGLGMSEQRLNHANVLATLEQMGRKAVAKRMQRDRLAQRRGFGGLLEQSPELTRSQRLSTATWKQPLVFGTQTGN